MLTKGVLLRPWCLVEIVTAMQADVEIVPVNIDKATATSFTYPDENFYAEFLKGNVLRAEAEELLREQGFSLEDTVCALRETFKSIALSYSPHRTEAIRREEIKALFKKCLKD